MDNIGDLGRFGELEFKRWCASVGLVVNGSLEQDATGWDCKVEYKKLLNNINSNPLQPENSLSHPIFDVQVKTTQKEKSTWSIKLEHLIRFVHSPYPAFICIINADLKKAITNHIYLIHIDEKHIYNILKKQRKILKKKKKLHGLTMSISADKRDLIKNNFHIEIEKKFKAVIGNSMQEYTAKKEKILKKIGYENYHGTLKFKADFDAINNHILGITSASSVQDVAIVDNRFGIAIEKKLTDALLEFKTDEKDATLTTICKHSLSLSLPVKIRKTLFDIKKVSAPYATILHEAFNIILYIDKIIIEPNVDNHQISFENCKIFSKIRSGMNRECKTTIFMNMSNLELPFHYELNSKIEQESYKWDTQVWIFNQIEKFNLSICDVNMQEIVEQSTVVSLMSMIHRAKDEEMKIGFMPHEDVTVEYDESGEILFALVINLNEWSFLFFYKMSSLSMTKNIEITTATSLSNIFFLDCHYVKKNDTEAFENLWVNKSKEYINKPFFPNEEIFLSFDYEYLQNNKL